MKTCYTAIFSNYDDLKEPSHVNMVQGWRMVCFTDQDIKSDVWEIVRLPVRNFDPIKTAREVKINFHKYVDSQYSLWIDATFRININLDTWWMGFKPPFTTIKHPFDKCVYKEIQSCQRARKAPPKVLHEQEKAYKAAGVPVNNGLIASGVLMRENTAEVREFCELWWKEVEKYSSRDQIAFGYANHVMPGMHHSIDWNYTRQREFQHIPHLHKASRRLFKTYDFLNNGKIQGNKKQ